MERTYIIPLRKEFQKVPTYKKSKKAVKAIKEFVIRHMKAKNFEVIKIQNELNNHVWINGIRNPPAKVKVNCKTMENGDVLVQLFGQAFPEVVKEEKKGIAQKLAEKVTGGEKKAAAAKKEAPAAPKPAPKAAAPEHKTTQPFRKAPEQSKA
ncbi:MAG: 50S ribosomal protein L31e [Nanoarchaeota archaeon]